MTQERLISAYYVAKSLPLPLIEKRNELALVTKRRNALIFGKPEDQMMFVFSYGVVVLFNFDAKHARRTVEARCLEVAEEGVDRGRPRTGAAPHRVSNLR